MEKQAIPEGGYRVVDIGWKAVLWGYTIGVVVTLAAGMPLLLTLESSWMLGLIGLGGLFAGGFVVGARVGLRTAIINGALMGILYNLTVVVALFAGWFFELLPEPLPGLSQGDSTFFFAWPLMQFAVSVIGAIVGSRIAVKHKERGA